MAEAIRLRLDELFKSGCGVGLDSKQLSSQVTLLSDRRELGADFTITAGHLVVSYFARDTSGLVLYVWRRGGIVTRINIAHAGPKLDERALLLEAKVFQPAEAPEPLLAVLSSSPFVEVCFGMLRFRVLEPSGDPIAPTVLLDHETDGYRCEGHEIATSGDRVSFTYPSWHSVFGSAIHRSRTASFEYHDGTLVERFGFPAGFTELVEDWLKADWSLASEASAPSNLAALEAEHDKLQSAAASTFLRSYRAELLPAYSASRRHLRVYCALSEAETTPCTEWPKPVDFVLKRQGERWLVASIVRP